MVRAGVGIGSFAVGESAKGGRGKGRLIADGHVEIPTTRNAGTSTQPMPRGADQLSQRVEASGLGFVRRLKAPRRRTPGPNLVHAFARTPFFPIARAPATRPHPASSDFLPTQAASNPLEPRGKRGKPGGERVTCWTWCARTWKVNQSTVGTRGRPIIRGSWRGRAQFGLGGAGKAAGAQGGGDPAWNWVPGRSIGP